MTTPALEQDVDHSVASVVRILLTYRRETQARLGLALGLGKATMSMRMSGARGWTAAEVGAMARHFNVPVNVFYDGPDELLRRSVQTVTHQYESRMKAAGSTVKPITPAPAKRAVQAPRSAAARPCAGAVRAA